MSIESYFAQNPADTGFATKTLGPIEPGTLSPVRLLATEFIKEGGNGLTDIDIRVAVSEFAEVENSKSALRNSGAIYLGVTLIAIEDILKHGFFDEANLNSMTLKGFDTSNWNPAVFSDPKTTPLSPDDIARISMVARKDKTFATFFQNGIYSLPRRLQLFLQGSQMLHSINSLVIPEYKKRAELLVNNGRNNNRN